MTVRRDALAAVESLSREAREMVAGWIQDVLELEEVEDLFEERGIRVREWDLR